MTASERIRAARTAREYAHDPVATLRLYTREQHCPHCDSTNLTEPYEMDGISGGEYVRRGLWWVCCRGCNRTVALDTLTSR